MPAGRVLARTILIGVVAACSGSAGIAPPAEQPSRSVAPPLPGVASCAVPRVIEVDAVSLARALSWRGHGEEHALSDEFFKKGESLVQGQGLPIDVSRSPSSGATLPLGTAPPDQSLPRLRQHLREAYPSAASPGTSLNDFIDSSLATIPCLHVGKPFHFRYFLTSMEYRAMTEPFPPAYPRVTWDDSPVLGPLAARAGAAAPNEGVCIDQEHAFIDPTRLDAPAQHAFRDLLRGAHQSVYYGTDQVGLAEVHRVVDGAYYYELWDELVTEPLGECEGSCGMFLRLESPDFTAVAYCRIEREPADCGAPNACVLMTLATAGKQWVLAHVAPSGGMAGVDDYSSTCVTRFRREVELLSAIELHAPSKPFELRLKKWPDEPRAQGLKRAVSSEIVKGYREILQLNLNWWTPRPEGGGEETPPRGRNTNADPQLLRLNASFMALVSKQNDAEPSSYHLPTAAQWELYERALDLLLKKVGCE
jgi:hypothetical protein